MSVTDVLAAAPGSHPHARAVLGAALAPGGSPSHAYLFHGPGREDKAEWALEFAAALLAEGASDHAGAVERARRRTHPDLTWVTPSGAHEMLVSDIDEAVVVAATRTPFESRRRVFVIERAETMHESAANRMLKTLEEPAAFVHLLLLTERPGDVLPTIVSRCQVVRFDPLSPEEIAERLGRRGIEPGPALACARLSLGDPDRAQALALGGGTGLRAAAEVLARGALRGNVEGRPWGALLAEAKTRADGVVAEVEQRLTAEREMLPRKDHRRHEREGAERVKRVHRREQTAALDQGLQLASLWYRDLLSVAAGAPDLALNADRAAELAQDAPLARPARLGEAIEYVEDTRRRLALNVTEDLACEALALRLARTLAG